MLINQEHIVFSLQILSLIAHIDGFKGQWKLLSSLSPERLQVLKRVATIESIGASTRIEGSQLSDSDVGLLLSNIKTYSFRSQDEQEVAGYAFVCETLCEQKLEREKIVATDVSENEAVVIRLLEQHGKLSISQLESFSSMNRNTLKKQLKRMVDQSQIVRHGKGRATWYTLY